VALVTLASGQQLAPPEEIENLSVGISDYLARNGKILRKFDFFLPKFHFILPKFHFVPRWRIFVCSVGISDFLGRDQLERLVLLVSLVVLVLLVALVVRVSLALLGRLFTENAVVPNKMSTFALIVRY